MKENENLNEMPEEIKEGLSQFLPKDESENKEVKADEAEVKEPVNEIIKDVVDEKKEDSSLGNILYDYLERNQSVVRKNLVEDKLNKNQLKELLSIEEQEKRRPLILNTIKRLLKK